MRNHRFANSVIIYEIGIGKCVDIYRLPPPTAVTVQYWFISNYCMIYIL